MKSSKVLFIISVLLIIFLTFSTQISKKENFGIVKEISYSNNKITIELENKSEKLVLFDKKNLNLRVGQEIYYIGKEDTYRNEKQIILEKLTIK